MGAGPVIAVLLGACAASGVGTPVPAGAPTSAAVLARHVYPFEVLDERGTPYDHPFLGGLNVPRPQLVDIEGDGDPDLFVQEYSGRVMFLENVGSPGAPRFLWRGDRFGGLEVGEWFRFADFDGDTDVDLLAEEPYSYIRYYRNDGGPHGARFVLATDTLRDVDGWPIFSDRQNIPNLTDIDCDGVPDLFIGKLVGTVTRYEAEGRGDGGVRRFRLLTDRFEGIEIISQIGSRHGANTMTFADVDGDGDQDFFWGDFFDATLLFIENTGSCEHPTLRGVPVPFPPGAAVRTSGYNAPALADLDGDGDLDLFVGVLGGAFNPNLTTVENFLFLEQLGDGSFAERTRRFLSAVDVGSESIPLLADFDDDGDLDLLLANKLDPTDPQTSRIYRLENVGTPAAPRFQLRGALPIRGQYHYAPVVGDLDGDGDLDMLVGSWRADVAYYRNDGTAAAPRWELAESALVTITRGSNTTPALVDIDADGDLDLFIGEASGTINFYRNEGTPREPRFVLVTDEFLGLDVGRRSAPTFADLDGDGDYDLVVGSESGALLLFRNAGTARAPSFLTTADTLAAAAAGLAAPAFADLDGDGDLDVIIGGVGGGVVYFANVGR